MAKKKMKDVGEIGEGLQAIANVKPAEPQPVAVPNGTVEQLLEGLLAQGKEIQEKADQAEAKCLEQLRIISTLEMAPQATRERPQAQQALRQANEYVNWYLDNPDVTLRRAGSMALFKFYLGNASASSPEQVRSALQELVARKALVETPTGPVGCLGRRYDIAVNRPETKTANTGIEPGSNEEREVRSLLETANRSSWQKVKAGERDEAGEWAAKATLTRSDLVRETQKDGTFCLGVYQPRRKIRDDQEVKPKVGVVFGERWGELLYIKGATGPMKGMAEKLAQAREGRGLAIPQSILLDNLDDHTDVRLELRTRCSEDEFRAAVAGYWALHWGLITTGLADLHREMSANTDLISMEEALIQRRNGTVLIEVFAFPRDKGDWNDGWMEGEQLYPRMIRPDGRILPAVFFLAEFFQPQEDQEGDERKIRVLQYPKHFENLLGKCEGSFPDDFSNCPDPLNRLLPAAYGETANRAHRQRSIEQKQAQVQAQQ